MYKQKFWMCYFGSPSPKPTMLWSTSTAIAAFKSFATMRKSDFKFDKTKKPVEKYRNGRGEVAYKGTKFLRGTQCPGLSLTSLAKDDSCLRIYTPRFAGFVVRMMPHFNDPKRKQPLPVSRSTPPHLLRKGLRPQALHAGLQ